MLEMTIPYGELEGISELFKEIPVVHVWTSGSPDGMGVVRVLLRSHDTEALSDIVVRRFGSRERFRLVLFPVEGTLPRAEDPEDLAAAKEAAEESEESRSRRISRVELHQDLEEAGRLTSVYIVMVILSTVVAAIGLIRGDLAIVIGAMVIAPLLGPNVALSLGCTLGDIELVKRSLKALAVGVGTAAILSMVLGGIVSFDPSSPALTARTQPGVGDVILALSAGAAGCLAFTSGVPAAVVGVMVAVALLPPLVVAGLFAGAGHTAPALGALILLLINMACINLAASATFFLQKVNPRTWWEADRAKKATRLAVIIWFALLLVLLALVLLGGVGGAV